MKYGCKLCGTKPVNLSKHEAHCKTPKHQAKEIKLYGKVIS
jgi:hypothetical protein